MSNGHDLPTACKAGRPQLIHGYWYSYCTRCGVYHLLRPRPKAFNVIPLQPKRHSLRSVAK